MNDTNPDWAPWVLKAEHDLVAMDAIANAADVPWDTVVFHAQQVAEKYLKALIVSRGQQPPRVHDLTTLMTKAVALGLPLEALEDDLTFLSPLALFARYPGDAAGEPSADDAERAMAIARRVRESVRAHIPCDQT